MKLPSANPPSAIRNPQSLRAFTMVEIALSLAIIAFALVAIIGVLPAGLSVQKDNREQTIINLDAAYLMDAIRHGPLGQDNLTNYIVSINVKRYQYQGNPGNGLTGLAGPDLTTYVFTNNSTVISNFGSVTTGGPFLTNGFNIIGLLGTPKYTYYVPPIPPPPQIRVWSNNVTAIFRAINAPAVDTGFSQGSKDFAFQYQVTVELARSAESPFAAGNGAWVNLTAPNYISLTNPASADLFSQALQTNLFELRLTFRWPVLPNGQLGAGRQVFRSAMTATYLTNVPPLPPPLPAAPALQPLPLGQSYFIPANDSPQKGIYLYFMQPDTYTSQL